MSDEVVCDLPDAGVTSQPPVVRAPIRLRLRDVTGSCAAAAPAHSGPRLQLARDWPGHPRWRRPGGAKCGIVM